MGDLADELAALSRQDANYGIADVPLNALILEGLVDLPGRTLTPQQAAASEQFSFDAIDPELAEKVRTVVARCAADGFTMKPYFGLRRPETQARLYRQSRTRAVVEERIAHLQGNGAPYLAAVLEGVGPQASAPWATNALPGLSWHQWGEAVDAYWLRDGEIDWNGSAGYRNYGEHGRDLGLNAGFFWNTQDMGHLQLRAASSPLANLSLPEIDAEMKAKFGPAPIA